MSVRSVFFLTLCMAMPAGLITACCDCPCLEDTSGESDTDTDSDTDSDTDTDTDSDTDADRTWFAIAADDITNTEVTIEGNDLSWFVGSEDGYSFIVIGSATMDGDLKGSLVYQVIEYPTTLCFTEISLSGAAWEGECPNCTFAYAIDAEILSEDGEDCQHDGLYAYIPGPSVTAEGDVGDLVLAFSSEHDAHTNALLTGCTLAGR